MYPPELKDPTKAAIEKCKDVCKYLPIVSISYTDLLNTNTAKQPLIIKYCDGQKKWDTRYNFCGAYLSTSILVFLFNRHKFIGSVYTCMYSLNTKSRQ